MEFEKEFEVFVLSVRKPFPPQDASEEEHSAFAQLTLKPLSMLSKQMIEVYAGPEYQEDGHYCREWAQRGRRGTMAKINLNSDIFSWRLVTAEEEFYGKYIDFTLTPDKIDPSDLED